MTGAAADDDAVALVLADVLGHEVGADHRVDLRGVRRPGAVGALAGAATLGTPNVLGLQNQNQVLCDQATTAVPQIKAGRVRALATGSGKRSLLLPELPLALDHGWTQLPLSMIVAISSLSPQ